MRNVFNNMKTKLPEPLAKRYWHMLNMGVAVSSVSLIVLQIYQSRSLTAAYLILGAICVVTALGIKVKIVNAGYVTRQFRIYDYTYVTRKARSPSGMLMRSIDGDWRIKYHLAVSDRCGLPELGSVIRVYVPESAKLESYGDRYYYPVVFGYETVE